MCAGLARLCARPFDSRPGCARTPPTGAVRGREYAGSAAGSLAPAGAAAAAAELDAAPVSAASHSPEEDACASTVSMSGRSRRGAVIVPMCGAVRYSAACGSWAGGPGSGG